MRGTLPHRHKGAHMSDPEHAYVSLPSTFHPLDIPFLMGWNGYMGGTNCMSRATNVWMSHQ